MSKPRRTKHQRGQGMTEYIIIVALVAIGAIAVVTIFGDNIRTLFGASANALAGQDTEMQMQPAEDTMNRDITNFNKPPP